MTNLGLRALSPHPFQSTLCDYLCQNEPELWQWMASSEAQSDYAESARLDLLKSTIRLDREVESELYAMVDKACGLLGIDATKTLYQSQDTGQASAALFYIPGEIHLVLIGRTRSLLSEEELLAVLAHELSHYLLWTMEKGRYLIAERVINAMAAHQRANDAHMETARLFQLYTEIFADRGALFVAKDEKVVIRSLLKTMTGATDISAEAYLRQAEEIFAKGKIHAEDVTHPEAYIRARATHFWSLIEWPRIPAPPVIGEPLPADGIGAPTDAQESPAASGMASGPTEQTPAKATEPQQQDKPKEPSLNVDTVLDEPVVSVIDEAAQEEIVKAVEGADTKVRLMIEGLPQIGALDILRQLELTHLTQIFLEAFLSRAILQTETVKNHARLFFPDIEWPELERPAPKAVAALLENSDSNVTEYFVYILLDFVTVDREIESVALAAALKFADQLKITEAFHRLAKKELGKSAKELAKLETNADDLLSQAAEQLERESK